MTDRSNVFELDERRNRRIRNWCESVLGRLPLSVLKEMVEDAQKGAAQNADGEQQDDKR